MITISGKVDSIPSAIFEFNNQKVLISIKPDIAQMMQKDIKYGVENYGPENPEYWNYIEELAMKYWAELDRNEIMDIRKYCKSK